MMPAVMTFNISATLDRPGLDAFELTQLFAMRCDFQIITATLIIITLVVIAQWLISRVQQRSQATASTEYVILDSEVSIDIGDDRVELEYGNEVNGGRAKLETLSNSAPAQCKAFNIDNLPILHIDQKSDSISERRGRKTLMLQASKDSDADMAMIDVKDGRLTVFPFSSKRETFKLTPDTPKKRKPAPKKLRFYDIQHPADIATAPYTLEGSWRPLDTPCLSRKAA